MKKFTTPRRARKSHLLIALTILIGIVIMAFAPTTIEDFFLPGSQPLQSGNLEHPEKCDNCHGGYDLTVEPAHNWRGSMMAQAMRDPLYMACLAIANQDAPDAGDLCIRCHSPAGWLEGRSIPTDGSALNNNDMEGVQCDFCHKLVKPATENPFPDDLIYTAETWPDDEAYLNSIQPNVPPQSANGMYVADNSNSKRGPFADAAAKHKMEYSPFHSESAICGTCHDVSNPAYDIRVDRGDGTWYYTTENFNLPAGTYTTTALFPVERTYSEWLNSEYATSGVETTVFGGNKLVVSTCQDCHMMDVSGYGANKKNIPWRDDLPLHDMTGGNTFIPGLIAQLFPGDVSVDALNDGVARARYMLQNAATMDVTTSAGVNGTLDINVKVTNETGHKLPSGYPEGRRIWINLKAYQTGGTIVEFGHYDDINAILTTSNTKVYEIKPGLSEEIVPVLDPSGLSLVDGPSFHFAINNEIFYDNRIPPRGFTNQAFIDIESPVIGYTYLDGQFWDNTVYNVPGNTERVVATLYYQTVSKEYVEFLRDENTTNSAGQDFYDLWAANGKSEPELMKQVEVSLAPPVADFDASPESGYAPLTVAFTDESYNGPTSWLWDFGDGSPTSMSQNPTHEFTEGTYTVTLTATNTFGSDSYSSTIQVDELTQTVIYVQDMSITRLTHGGNRQSAECEILIWDQSGNPVSGATVTADYDGPTIGTKSAVTNGAGIATIQSKATKNASGNWCFTVTDVSNPPDLYNPNQNAITTACESKSMAYGEAENIHIDQVFPNPFVESSTIRYTLDTDAYVTMKIYMHSGQEVATMIDAQRAAGSYELEWRAGHLPAGIYFIRMIAGDEVVTWKVLKTD